ncbi:hypothetical protein C8F04DRAFT_959966 [Mycena alexandri]|uniref:Uncharacterized protein n=1 Tax=Mycena alexandri TaxID=1745969 RepID=A0AAD6X068_9AGAR|nr:hypothetical protein C8F04DRAFT_959966 [Mycena alexandri]
MGSPFATQEDSESLWYEQSTYVSTHLASMGFGIHLVVFAMVTYHTLLLRTSTKSRIWVFWLVFNTLLFAIGTINLACSIRYNENAWVNERAYPGGPFNYLIEEQSVPFITLGNVASILASFMSDGLLLWRAGVLWRFAWYIVVPPAMFFVACIILSVMVVIQLALPNVSLPQLSLAVWIVLMLLPIWLTMLIAGRILYHRRTIINVLGPEYATNYTGISAIVIESALPFTIISIVLLGLFGGKSTAQNLFVPLLVQVECIAPEMIILRVVLGRSWTTGTMSREGKDSDLRFNSPGKINGRPVFDPKGAALDTQSTRSQTDETAGRTVTPLVFRHPHEKHEEKVENNNPSGSTVNVV